MEKVIERGDCILAHVRAALEAFAGWFSDFLSDKDWEYLLSGYNRAVDGLELLGKTVGKVSGECKFHEAVSYLGCSSKRRYRHWWDITEEAVEELHLARTSRHSSFRYHPERVVSTIARTTGLFLYWIEKVLGKHIEQEISSEIWQTLIKWSDVDQEIERTLQKLAEEELMVLGTCRQCQRPCFDMTAGKCRRCLVTEPTLQCPKCSQYYFHRDSHYSISYFEFFYNDAGYWDYDTNWSMVRRCQDCYRQIVKKRTTEMQEKHIPQFSCPSCGCFTFGLDEGICCVCGHKDKGLIREFYDPFDDGDDYEEEFPEEICFACGDFEVSGKWLEDGFFYCQRCIAKMSCFCCRQILLDSQSRRRLAGRAYCNPCAVRVLDRTMANFGRLDHIYLDDDPGPILRRGIVRRGDLRPRAIRYLIESVANNRL